MMYNEPGCGLPEVVERKRRARCGAIIGDEQGIC